MATSHGETELEYESDPEDAPLPSMRRREASDDESGEESGDKGLGGGGAGSDVDSDEQGAAQVYDDVDDVEEEEEYYDEDEEDVEEKKEEPFAVPTSGAFYMHDDRFSENGRGRRRRIFGSQKLWDHKEEHAWLHDRFEEMNVHDSRYNEEKQRPKGRFRGRGGPGRGGGGRGYASGRPRNYNEDSESQNRAPRIVRGRGPRRYEPRFKNYRENTTVQRKQSPAKPFQEASINSGAGNPPAQSAGAQKDRALPQKHSFSSSLNYASPPFYPSGSSSQDILIQKRVVQGGIDSKSLPYSMQLQDTSQTSNSSSLLRAKAVIEASGQDKFFYDDSIQNVASKPLSSSNVQSSGFSLPSANVVQPTSLRSQGRGSNTTSEPSIQSTATLKQAGRVSSQVHSSVVHQRPVQPPTLPALRVSTQQVAQRPGGGNQASPPTQPPSGSSEVGESDSPPGSSKSKTSLVAKSKVNNNQGAGRGSFLYGGAQVIGAAGGMGLAHGDQNFPGTPALLPVMQFGGQHPNGLGVPAMGMALPGYVAQPGFGNSEMTWVPVLAGAAGALGGSYCPPYITLDSSYYANQGQTQPPASSRETGTSKPDGSLKSTQRPEIVNDESGQRQNKPRRYSAMSFGQ